ncbi:hypothetical protein SAMN02745121_07244 [Nannocystis exedens]|uniref:J domain-containing protein n=1 Tax=Nannocystis exedens TaxID=54 RepID=A0A1I2GFP2_9BACT|nr:hypothetical protein SAMN02745121_07244 [Nannocystis exedens]
MRERPRRPAPQAGEVAAVEPSGAARSGQTEALRGSWGRGERVNPGPREESAPSGRGRRPGRFVVDAERTSELTAGRPQEERSSSLGRPVREEEAPGGRRVGRFVVDGGAATEPPRGERASSRLEPGRREEETSGGRRAGRFVVEGEGVSERRGLAPRVVDHSPENGSGGRAQEVRLSRGTGAASGGPAAEGAGGAATAGRAEWPGEGRTRESDPRRAGRFADGEGRSGESDPRRAGRFADGEGRSGESDPGRAERLADGEELSRETGKRRFVEPSPGAQARRFALGEEEDEGLSRGVGSQRAGRVARDNGEPAREGAREALAGAEPDGREAEEATVVLPSRHWSRRSSDRGAPPQRELSRETWPVRHVPEDTARSGRHGVREATEELSLTPGAAGGAPVAGPPRVQEQPPRLSPETAGLAGEAPLAGAQTRGESDAPALLAELRRERFTGGLRVAASGAPERRLWWSEGQVIGGASSAPGESVLGRLAARGLLSPTHLELAARWGTGDPRRDVERLAQSGLIKPQEMREALREPVRRIVERIAESGSVAWGLYPGEAPAVAVELGVPLAAMIAGGVQRGATLSQLRVAVNDDRKPRLAFAGPEALAAELRWPAVGAVTERFDGQTRVGELIAAAVADEAVIRGVVYVLELLGHLAPEIDDPAATLTALDRQRVRERLRLARESDYFALLGLPREASRADVLRAHADLTATFCESLEPDSRVELAEEIEELLAALDEARDVLSDDALHSAYLAQIGAS